jgi:cytochrome c biogenesis protein CcmG, thiol:disulfide interchange protein DsbE
MKLGRRPLGLAEDAGELLTEPVMPRDPKRRRRQLLWLGLGALVLTGAAVSVGVSTSDHLSKTTGTIKLAGGATLFTLDDVRPGRPAVSLEKLQGKPVVLNFFGSWCPPCLRELPGFEAVSQRFGSKVAFVGVTFNDTRPGAQQALAKAGITYAAGWDPENGVALDYGLVRMPTTVFISPKGTLLERKDGEFTEVQLEATINRLFFP